MFTVRIDESYSVSIQMPRSFRKRRPAMDRVTASVLSSCPRLRDPALDTPPRKPRVSDGVGFALACSVSAVPGLAVGCSVRR